VTLLREWNKTKQLSLDIRPFENGPDFLHSCETNSYDLVFMDIYMGPPDGIETAEKMKLIRKNTILVFLTSSADHMPSAFSLHAFDYLLKPLVATHLYKVLDDIHELTIKSQPHLDLPIDKMLIPVLYKDIRYIVSDSNYTQVFADSEYRCRSPFKTVTAPLESDDRFILVNRGILVNMEHVRDMETVFCVMDDKTELPINTKRINDCKQALITFQFDRRIKKL